MIVRDSSQDALRDLLILFHAAPSQITTTAAVGSVINSYVSLFRALGSKKIVALMDDVQEELV